jgi:signal transduction histidine kinase
MLEFSYSMYVLNSKSVDSLYKSIIAIAAPTLPKNIYKAIVEESCKLVDAEYGAIFTMPEGRKLKRIYSTVPHEYEIQPSIEGNSFKAYINKQIYILGEKEIAEKYPAMHEAGTKSLLILPLFYENESLGVLTLRSRKNFHFDKKKVDVLKLFITVAGLKIRNSYLREETRTQLKYRKEFAALASHELKTPLTIISLYAQMIQESISKSKDLKDDWFITIQTQIDKMTNIINEFLTIKKIKERNLNYHWKISNLSELLKDVVKNYSVINPDRKIDLVIRTGVNKVRVKADEQKLQGVFINIINNSIKFSPSNSVISIDLKVEDNMVCVEFQDRGVGIKKKDLPYVFEPFFRGGKIKRTGSGMGLYLSKNVILAHKGKIDLESSYKLGTKVMIKLPVFKTK